MNQTNFKRAAAQQSWGPRGTAGVSFAAALSFDNVDVHVGGRHVLKNVNMSLEPGEIVCLLGESGSGKSTVLQVAVGILPVQGGEVKVNDTLVSAPGIMMAPEKRGIGLMFQDFALFPHLSVLDNVAFGLESLGRKEALRQARSALERVGLIKRETDYPYMLSGGQQQRLALARTFAPRPGILMLDEPFSSLDARLRESVRAETLAILRETRATTLIVTHDPEEAMVLGDRIALLAEGRVVQIDQSSAVYNHPVDLGVARFFSPLTEIAAVVNRGSAETPLGRVPTPKRRDGEKVIVAFRPVGCLDIAEKNHGVAGRIVSKRQALGVDIYEVQVQGVDTLVHVRTASKAHLHAGSDILLTLNPEHVLVFGKD